MHQNSIKSRVFLVHSALLLAGVMLGFSAMPLISAHGEERILSMEVEKAHGSGLTAAAFDQTAANAGAIAQKKDNELLDVSCPLSVVRSGDIVENQLLPKEITTRKQLDAISKLHVDVFVMDQLSVCGKYENEPAVVGCDRPGPILVEAGSDGYLTLIHEVGHRSGIGSHSTTDDLCTIPTTAPDVKFNNIMFCKRHPTRTWLTQSNCDRIRKTPSFRAEQPDLDGATAPAIIAVEAALPVYSATQQLLMGLFGETIDFAGIAALTEAQLQEIRAELSGEDPRFWENAAYVLGIRGTEHDLESLVALAHRAANIDSPEGFRVRTAVPEAIGFYLSFHKDQQAPDWARSFLLENVAPENARTLAQGEDEPNLLAQRYAQGAALSGDLDIARAALDILSARQFDSETIDSIANRALASQTALPEEVLGGAAPAIANPQFELRNRTLEQSIDPTVISTLRKIGLGPDDSTLITDFSVQQFQTIAPDLEQLDKRVQTLNQEQMFSPQ